MATRKIHLKLRETALAPTAIARLSQMNGILAIEPLFEHETDPELATLYVVEIDNTATDVILQLLTRDPAVEFAEAPPFRTPI